MFISRNATIVSTGGGENAQRKPQRHGSDWRKRQPNMPGVSCLSEGDASDGVMRNGSPVLLWQFVMNHGNRAAASLTKNARVTPN